MIRGLLRATAPNNMYRLMHRRHGNGEFSGFGVEACA